MRLVLRPDSPEHGDGGHTFTRQGGCIGRGADCDLVLHCPERLISRRHADVLFEEGRFWLRDQSANGLFHNQSSTPVGAGNKVPLADGDTLRIGNYLIHVELEPEQGTQPNVDPLPPNADTLPAPSRPTLPDAAIGDAFTPPPIIPDDFRLVLEPAPAQAEAAPATVVARRLSALQRAPSRALLGQLFTDDDSAAKEELTAEAAAQIGRALRLCLDTLFALREEYTELELSLIGARGDSATATEHRVNVDQFCQALLRDETSAGHLAELQQLCLALQGRHQALYEGCRAAVVTVVEQFSPEKCRERFANRRGAAPNPLRTGGAHWRFYRDWYQQQRRDEFRPVQQLFDKKVLSLQQKRSRQRAGVHVASVRNAEAGTE